MKTETERPNAAAKGGGPSRLVLLGLPSYLGVAQLNSTIAQ
jgi:hypothetical protein